MKTVFIMLLVTLPTAGIADDSFRPQLGRVRTQDEVDPWLRDEYRERLKERRVYALEQRRAINSQRPPARGWTAVVVPFDPIGPIAIQGGWIIQPSPYRFRSYLPYRLDPFVPSCSH